MCGICGIFHFDGQPVDQEQLQRMTDALGHRGPDGQGVWTAPGVGLGHRRLAILDPSDAGAQPMLSPDGRLTLTYNGEMYNFRELRAELEPLGFTFRTGTDTEVVLAAYAAWGERCLERFNGMFALALWDQGSRSLLLARDRYGIKPLYWTLAGDTLLFASEQKGILAHPRVSRELDMEALVEYFTFQNIFTDRTLIKGVRLFPAGSHAMAHPGSPALPAPVRFWDYSFQEPESPLPETRYQEELDHLFQQAVQRQLVSDVEVGAYLSGGIDSGSIVNVAARTLPRMRTFTCGFDMRSASGLELGFDERERAEHMSYLYGTEHYEVVLKAGDMERVLPMVARSLEEPRVGQCYPNYCVAGLASRFVKVVLAGTGGDEMFGGYPWRYYRGLNGNGFDGYIDKYYNFWQRLVPDGHLSNVLSPIWDQVRHVDPKEIFRGVFPDRSLPRTRPEDYVNLSLYFEARTFLHGLLMVEDKLSMAHGLEVRVPYLDNDLVDFAMRLPMRLKLNNLQQYQPLDENEPGRKADKYWQRTRDGKVILRQALEKYVPDVVSQAPKQGFSGPDASWFRGDSIEYVKSVLFNGQAALYEVLNRKAVQGLVREHLDGRVNRRLLIWSLLCVEKHLQHLMDG